MRFEDRFSKEHYFQKLCITVRFINAVLKERMLEFGGEYKRWWDIQRRKLGPQAFGTSSIEPNSNRETDRPIYSAEKNYLLPIPQQDRNRNPNLTQNAGYN